MSPGDQNPRFRIRAGRHGTTPRRPWSDLCAHSAAPTVTVALSGGSTPGRLYRTLAEEYRTVIPWDRLEVFFGDERAVAPDHPESNYRLGLRVPPLPRGRSARTGCTGLRADEKDLAEAARAYEDVVRRRVAPGPEDVPAFDLVWLGTGEDGHTASLFPGMPALREERRLVVETAVPYTGSATHDVHAAPLERVAEGPVPRRRRIEGGCGEGDFSAARLQLRAKGRRRRGSLRPAGRSSGWSTAPPRPASRTQG